MLFNSYEFILLFLPITFILYFYLLSQRLILGAKIFLVIASLFFYGYWNFSYVPLILLSIFVNYSVGLSLVNHEKIKLSSKSILIFGILFNVGLLGYFKYTDFLLDNFNGIFGSNIPLPHIILPLGISFFTFTQIAFLVDAYKKEAKEYSLVNYMLFVTYFPHLLAGPILHHKEMMPQFASKYNWVKNYRNIALGLFIFSIGLFKKVVIADTFAPWATAGFDTATTLNLIEAWATSLSYTFQLYFDFSGYCDMAIGISLMFNIKLPINFNSPYKALNIQDFWRRWHMTLSRFLRDYIYIPLGGNRKGNARTYVNLLSTFLNFNHLSDKLKNIGIELFLMPAVDKYDLYYPFIKNNYFNENDLFKYLRNVNKNYYLIDTKKILEEELLKNEVDIFYADDTHWSYKASEAIANNLKKEIDDVIYK